MSSHMAPPWLTADQNHGWCCEGTGQSLTVYGLGES